MLLTGKGNDLAGCVALICQAEVSPTELPKRVYITHAGERVCVVVAVGMRACWANARCWKCLRCQNWEKKPVCLVAATVAETPSAYSSCLPNPTLTPGTLRGSACGFVNRRVSLLSVILLTLEPRNTYFMWLYQVLPVSMFQMVIFKKIVWNSEYFPPIKTS